MGIILSRIDPIWRRWGVGSDPGWFANAVERNYRQPHRRHHNLTHLSQGWSEIELMPGGLIIAPDTFELAWIGHDLVYEVIEGLYQLNEINSGQLMVELLRQAGFPEYFIRQVYDLIIVTDHQHQPQTPDQQLIADLDLSQLALPASVFRDNYRNIRQEFQQVPDQMYALKLAQLFRNLLARQRIYHTDYFFRRCEAAARDNLTTMANVLEAQVES